MSVFSDLVERARALVFRDRDDRELQEELQFHLEMEEAQDRAAGTPADEARRRSLIALGGIERTRTAARDARGTRLVEDTVADTSYALRTLARNPGFALAAVLTLGVGIGATTAVYGAFEAVLLRPLPYEQPGQLVRLYQHVLHEPDEPSFVTPVHFLEFRNRLSTLDGAAAIRTYSVSGADIGRGDAARRIRTLPVSADYFDVLGVSPARGRSFDRSDHAEADVVVLSHELWRQQLHSDAAALGGTLMMSGVPHTIVGVMPPGFTDVVAGPVDAWVPLDLQPGRNLANVRNHYLTVIARLRPGLSIASAQAELDRVAADLSQEYPSPSAPELGARLYSLTEDVTALARRPLRLMLGAVALILLLVCANVAGLSLLRGAERRDEFALRSALGAERIRLVRQLLVESAVLTIVGSLAGLVVARVAMSAIVSLAAESMPRLSGLSLSPGLLGFSVVVTALCTIASGLVPALRTTRTQPSEVLRGHSRSTPGRTQVRARECLVVSQIALAFLLLVGAGLLLASVHRLGQVDLGIAPDRAIVFELHLPAVRYDAPARARLYEQFAEQAEALASVVAAGGVSKLPATGSYHQWSTVPLSGPLARERDDALDQRVVSGHYFAAAGIPVLEGRVFDARDDAEAPKRVVVSRQLATQFFPEAQALGQRLFVDGQPREIIGVVGDVATTPEGETAPHVYHAHTQFADDRNWGLTQVVRAAGAPAAAQAEVRRLLAALDPELVMHRPSTLADVIGRGETTRTFTLNMLGTFALTALALSALGLFGVLSYGVRLRTREFGVRIALGATPGTVQRMVLRQGMTLAALGVALGLAGSLGLGRVMTSLVFQISPLDPLVLTGAVLFMGTIAGLAAYVPAKRASSVEPRSAMQ